MICHLVIVLLWFAFGALHQNAAAHTINLPNLKNKRNMGAENSEESAVRKPHTKSTEYAGATKRGEDDFEEISVVHIPEQPKAYGRRHPSLTRHGIHTILAQNIKRKLPHIRVYNDDGEKMVRDKILSLDFVHREESDHSLFGRFVAASLRNVTDRELSIELQHEILKAIMRTQIRILKQDLDLKNMSVLHAVATTTASSSQSKRESYDVNYDIPVKEVKSEDVYKTTTDSDSDSNNFALYSK